MKSKPPTGLPTGRLRRAFDMAKVGARAGASWAASKGADAAAKHSAEVLGNLRGIAAKVGQTASYVDGLIPPEQREVYEKALSKLQKATPPSPFVEVKKTIEDGLGQPLGELFTSFDETPVASASIGQVHRARLPNGTEVAVKVQHAGIEEAVESDLRNISMLEGVVTLAGPKGLKAKAIFDEVMLRFRQELDYEHEAKNQLFFTKLHEDDPLIHVPEVHLSHTKKRVLTSTWVDGISLAEAAQKPEELRQSYARALWRFVFRGNLVGGAFNADPHPGNYLFHDDGSITFLDFGCVQPIPENIRKSAVRAHAAAVSGDLHAFDAAVAQMLGTHGGKFGEATRKYTTDCFRPLLSESFQLTPEYAATLFSEARSLKKAMGAKDGSFVAPPPELALMNRLQFGFYSVIAQLNVEVSFRQIESEFLEEAAALSHRKFEFPGT